MNSTPNTVITVQAIVNKPVSKVWECWTKPEHIVKWNNASDDWHTPYADNELRPGGRFISRMEAKDKSMGFDFSGTYDKVIEHKYIEYTIDDGRKVIIAFIADPTQTEIVESFEAESTNPIELQRAGWQAILDNFKKYTETHF